MGSAFSYENVVVNITSKMAVLNLGKNWLERVCTAQGILEGHDSHSGG